MRKLSVYLIAVFFSVGISFSCFASEMQIIAGAGPSTKIVKMFFEEFPDSSAYSFEVPPKSIKHAGGIKASGTNIFGRTGRPLNEKEKSLNKDEIPLAQIPVAIVVGQDTGVTKIDLKQLEEIITGKIENWKDLGGSDHKITVIGREPTEALFTILKVKYKFFADAKFDRVFKKDEAIVNLMMSPIGKYAIAFGAKPNFENVETARILSIDGFRVGVSLGLVYDLSNSDHALVNSVKTYASSEEWSKTVIAAGYLPPEN